MSWLTYMIIGFFTLLPTFWLALKGKVWTNQLLFKGDVDEGSPKSWLGDIVATGVFFVYSVVMYNWMPK